MVESKDLLSQCDEIRDINVIHKPKYDQQLYMGSYGNWVFYHYYMSIMVICFTV